MGRVGTSLPTKEVLDFGLAHARARDAVHIELDKGTLEAAIQAEGFLVMRASSLAVNRSDYLLRPDLGRRLDEASKALIHSRNSEKPIDLLIVIGDGLSSLAVQRHALPVLMAIRKRIPSDWHIGPIILASQARVALSDEIGETLNARMVAILIGERPGLSSPDSLGIYLTYRPRVGLTDANRNCISNIRPEGLGYDLAADKLAWLAKEALRMKVSGVSLKDESDIKQVTNDQA